jgi:hypothetical protein
MSGKWEGRGPVGGDALEIWMPAVAADIRRGRPGLREDALAHDVLSFDEKLVLQYCIT